MTGRCGYGKSHVADPLPLLHLAGEEKGLA